LGDAFSGVVNINTVIFDPKYGFLESFKSVHDSSKEVVFGCVKTDGNTFVMTGRNGLPSDPADLLTTVIAIANPMDLVKTELHPTTNRINKQKITHQQYSQNIEEVEEAAGWLVDKTGQVKLVANRNLQSGKSEISPPIETSTCLQHQYSPMPETKI
jgi:large exoprotein involved in heme utilization and adhesion